MIQNTLPKENHKHRHDFNYLYLYLHKYIYICTPTKPLANHESNFFFFILWSSCLTHNKKYSLISFSDTH